MRAWVFARVEACVRACMCVRARYFERVCVGVRVLRVYVRIWVSAGVYDN